MLILSPPRLSHDRRDAPFETFLRVQRENHVNSGVDFDWLAIEQSRTITPLAYGVQRSLYQQRVARHYLELLHRAFLGNDGVQADGSGDACLACQRRINRLDTVDE